MEENLGVVVVVCVGGVFNAFDVDAVSREQALHLDRALLERRVQVVRAFSRLEREELASEVVRDSTLLRLGWKA